MKEKPSAYDDAEIISVSDQNLEIHNRAFLDLNLKEIIPPNAVVVNMGSGVEKLFEKELLKERPDINFVSVDFSLGLEDYTKGEAGEESKNSQWTVISPTNLHDKTSIYAKKPLGQEFLDDIEEEKLSELTESEKRRHWKKRYQSLKEVPGSVAMKAPKLALADNSADTVVDFMGAYQYLKDDQARKEYLGEIRRILKPGGALYIYADSFFPETLAGQIEGLQVDEERVRSGKRVLKISKA